MNGNKYQPFWDFLSALDKLMFCCKCCILLWLLGQIKGYLFVCLFKKKDIVEQCYEIALVTNDFKMNLTSMLGWFQSSGIVHLRLEHYTISVHYNPNLKYNCQYSADPDRSSTRGVGGSLRNEAEVLHFLLLGIARSQLIPHQNGSKHVHQCTCVNMTLLLTSIFL